MRVENGLRRNIKFIMPYEIEKKKFISLKIETSTYTSVSFHGEVLVAGPCEEAPPPLPLPTLVVGLVVTPPPSTPEFRLPGPEVGAGFIISLIFVLPEALPVLPLETGATDSDEDALLE